MSSCSDMDQYDFQLRRKTFKIDWKQLAGVDVESVVRCGDFGALQANLRHVVYCDASAEFASCADVSLLKVFKLSQLIAEYLLQCQHVLSAGIADLRRQLQLAKQCLKKTKLKLERSEKELARWCKYRKNCKNGKQCDTCGKVFISQTYLNSHVVRRHGDKHTVVQHRQQQTPPTVTVDVATMTSPDLTRVTPVLSPDQQNYLPLSPSDPLYPLLQLPAVTSDQLHLQLLRQRLSQVEQLLLSVQPREAAGSRSKHVAVQAETDQLGVSADPPSSPQDRRPCSAECCLLEIKLADQQREISQLQQKLSRLAGDSGGKTRAVSPGLVAPPSEPSHDPPASGSSTTVFSTVSSSASVLETVRARSEVSGDDSGSDSDGSDALETNTVLVGCTEAPNHAVTTSVVSPHWQLQASSLDGRPVPATRTSRQTADCHSNDRKQSGSNHSNNSNKLSDSVDSVAVNIDDVARSNNHQRRRGRRQRRYDWGILCSPTTSRVHHGGDGASCIGADGEPSPPSSLPPPPVQAIAPSPLRQINIEYNPETVPNPTPTTSTIAPSSVQSKHLALGNPARFRYKPGGRLASLARALRRRVAGRPPRRLCRSEERLNSGAGVMLAPPTASVESLPAAAGVCHQSHPLVVGADVMSDQYLTAESQPQTPQRRCMSRADGGYSARKQKRPAPPLPPSLTL